MQSLRMLAAGVLATGGLLAGAAPADAACYGTQRTVYTCPRWVAVYSDCIYTGSGPCTPVTFWGTTCFDTTVFGGAPLAVGVC